MRHARDIKLEEETIMKKFVSLLLILALMLSAQVFVASAEEEPATEEPMVITWLGASPPLTDDTWGEQAFEEAFGVDVQIVRAETAEEQTVLFASGEVPDFILAGSVSRLADLVDQDIVRPVTLEMIEENMPGYYAMCTSYDPGFFDKGIVDNEIYAVPRYNATGEAAIGAAIRSDWLENLGLAVPTTLEELEAVFYAFAQDDPDGNGQDDTYALSAGGNSGAMGRYMFQSIFGIFGVNPLFWTENEEGELEYGFTTDEVKEALKLLSKWYADGLIDPEFITTDARSSGTDVASKFASGQIGYIDCLSYDDYQWDNDGHMSAKWVANDEAWQQFFADNVENPTEMYKYGVTSDFDDSYVSKYYINLAPVANSDGTPGGYVKEGNVNSYLCFGANTSDEKVAKILQILEQEAMDEDTYMLHFGPEGLQWLQEEDGTRSYNPNYTEEENYHPQGQILGYGWCLFPMYWSNPEFLTVISDARNDQRYERTLPLFASFNDVSDALTVSLPSASEYSEITSTYITNNVYMAIRGDIDVETQWDDIVAEWFAMGGDVLTQEANEWWDSVNG